MYLGNTLSLPVYPNVGKNVLATAGLHIRKSDLDFFTNEMNGGCTVYFYGTYEGDGDFDTFSKIITSMSITKEQRDLFESDEDELAYYQKFADLIKSNDPELISVDFDIL